MVNSFEIVSNKNWESIEQEFVNFVFIQNCISISIMCYIELRPCNMVNNIKETMMKILVYGAGAIGSIFAGKLIKAGFNVTVLARNERYNEHKSNGNT